MCLDSMQRREKEGEWSTNLEGSKQRYTLQVSKMEQAGYLVIISFDARGDGSQGSLQRPEASRLLVDGVELSRPELGLRVNLAGSEGVAGRFDGTLTFALDGRCRSSSFQLSYGQHGYPPLLLEFDSFQLTKMQKTVTRFLGGYLYKEWEVNGGKKTTVFLKQSTRALVADVYQQENLNDCGVFVLENGLRSCTLQADFLRSMASASTEALKSFPWPTQQDITARKSKLKAITARLFAVAAEKNDNNVEKLLEDGQLKAEVLASLVDDHGDAGIDEWQDKLKDELAARQVDKDIKDKELKERDQKVQLRREEERLRREEEAAKAEAERLRGKTPPRAARALSSSNSSSRSRSRRHDRSRSGKKKKKKDKDKDKKKKKEKKKKDKDKGKSKKDKHRDRSHSRSRSYSRSRGRGDERHGDERRRPRSRSRSHRR
eukprot:NODE_5804_length_1733_cov_14.627024.p1 GENE.NODE_5804_length_1733_cov_14.627024~~NODE_5804_length_1733_cov_14.627024.p1  ORF type:complete len:498 (-),score=176.91 NODE_5804_length_1733_cov_14.627024:240-1535(-)